MHSVINPESCWWGKRWERLPVGHGKQEPVLLLQPAVRERQRAAAALQTGSRQGPLPRLRRLQKGFQASDTPQGQNCDAQSAAYSRACLSFNGDDNAKTRKQCWRIVPTLKMSLLMTKHWAHVAFYFHQPECFLGGENAEGTCEGGRRRTQLKVQALSLPRVTFVTQRPQSNRFFFLPFVNAPQQLELHWFLTMTNGAGIRWMSRSVTKPFLPWSFSARAGGRRWILGISAAWKMSGAY